MVLRDIGSLTSDVAMGGLTIWLLYCDRRVRRLEGEAEVLGTPPSDPTLRNNIKSVRAESDVGLKIAASLFVVGIFLSLWAAFAP